jgi:hypothetical protein
MLLPLEPRIYRRGSASRMILIKSGQDTSFEYEPCKPGNGFSLYRPGLDTFSHLFVLNVYKVGHPLKIINPWLERWASVIIYSGTGFGSSY